eukprot:Blabericola_migrator_1__11912@NODE_727_length_6713_cov_119_729461_g523_i0_p3_GENE_NODE_727_length_6713_cov_119_729461_g523_i0NODE_727_length_6713_cov_119_729461_g523_i0_p3_ORF_typecomplete_len281_score48_81_NODE_727_length_6713_cov_119_729461_g523_i030103852
MPNLEPQEDLTPWLFKSLNPREPGSVLSRDGRVLLRTYVVQSNRQDTPSTETRFARWKKLIHISTKPQSPDLISHVNEHDLLSLETNDEFFRLLQEGSESPLPVSAVLLSAELVDASMLSESKHLLVPLKRIRDDGDLRMFLIRFKSALLDALKLDVSDPSKAQIESGAANNVKYLSFPTLPLKPHTAAVLIPTISVYISDADNQVGLEALAKQNLDRLSVAVSKLQSDQAPLSPDASPFWLSRLDPAALQRYMRELTDGLCSSVETAFEGDVFYRSGLS